MRIRRPDFSRRVAVTGLGIISPIGQDIDDRLGQPRQRAQRPARDHPLGPDALRGAERRARSTTSTARKWMDFKAIRRTDRNVVFGVAAAKQALPTPGSSRRDEPRRHRRHLRLGRRRPDLLMENLEKWETSGRASCQPVLHRQHAARHGVGPDRHRDRASAARTCASSPPARPARTTSARRPRASAAATSSRPSPAPPRTRCTSSATSASRNMRGMGTPREGEALTDRLAAVRQDAQRLRAGRGRGRDDARGPRVRQGARRQGLRRGRGLRLGRRCVGPHPADREGRRHAPRDGSRRSSATACRRDEIDLINPHGTSTPLGDLREAQAIWAAFGDHTPEIAISAPSR